MTAVYITIDTEYSAGLYQSLGHGAQAENFERSISCKMPDGEVGIFHQMDVMEANGIRGVFFVDPMPALVWGVGSIRAIVEPIVSRGHDVQLHLHPEWLALAGDANPLDGRIGRNIRDFSEPDQEVLIRLARDLLVDAGAPAPIAFRAGNYGANDATLRALKRCGITYDSSHAPGIDGSECALSLGPQDQKVVRHEGVLEVPIGSIRSFGGLRHVQVTAVSAWELGAALRYAARKKIAMINIVSHSFELLDRDRSRTNVIVRDRFRRFCETIAETGDASSATFTSRPPRIGDETGCSSMPHSEIRSAARIAEQILSNSLYGKS